MISVIIPVYNTGKYLERCMDSILNQTYKDLQIFLINDGSTDDSLVIMEAYEKMDLRVHIIDLAHSGVSAARNAGVREATGEYISFIDSDDWIALNTYSIMLDILRENDADAVYYEWTEEYSEGSSKTKTYKGKRKLVIEGENILKKYFENVLPMRLSSGLLKRSLLKDVFFEVGRDRGEDMLVSFFTIAKAKRVVWTDLPLYHRYHRKGSLSNQIGFDCNDLGRATCTDYMVEYVQQNNLMLLQNAYVYSFNFYMVVLNQILYYRCEKEYPDIYDLIKGKLRELWNSIESPMRELPKKVWLAYIVFLNNKMLYHLIMIVYYRYIKKELGGKRQQ